MADVASYVTYGKNNHLIIHLYRQLVKTDSRVYLPGYLFAMVLQRCS